MLAYCFRRLIASFVTLGLLVALTFFILRLAPGGPFDSERTFPPEILENINRQYGLNDPMIVQFGSWVRDLFHGNLRESFQYLGKPVTEIILQALPISVGLGVISLLFSIVVGLPIGCLAAWRRGSGWDSFAMLFAVSGISLPGYLVASILILIFSMWLGWLPPALWEDWTSAILPILTLSLRPIALIARMIRASMLEAFSSDYIRTAESKGVSPFKVVFKHALKNSLLPTLTLIGPIAASLVTGSFLVEMIFQIPGIGKHFVTAVINRDYPLVMGVTLVYGVILLVSNWTVDLLYGWIDPRIKYS